MRLGGYRSVIATLVLLGWPAPAAAQGAGWSYTTHPTGGGVEVFTTVLRDAPQSFVSLPDGSSVWRFSPAEGWVKLAAGGPGDPSLFSLPGRLYVAWGANNGTRFDPRRPWIRISDPASTAPASDSLSYDRSPRGKQHESLFSFDASGEGRFAGLSVGAVPPATDASSNLWMTNPEELGRAFTADDLAHGRVYPYRIQGLTAASMPPLEDCEMPSPAPTATPGVFAWGCLTSLAPGTYTVVFEGPDGGYARRVAVATGARTFPGGPHDLYADRGDGVLDRVALPWVRPSLAYSPRANAYLALVQHRQDVGPAGLHWYLSSHLYVSLDGGATWTHGVQLCGAPGADCAATSVVYDEVADRFWVAWLQRGEGYARRHSVHVGFVRGRDLGAGMLPVTSELVEPEVPWDDLDDGVQNDVWANGQIGYGNFVAVGYAKGGRVVFAYKQFAEEPAGP